MKYFISNYYDGCWYYRCYLPSLYNGFSGDKESFSSSKDRQHDAFMVTKADTVIFQRPDEFKKLRAAEILKKMGKKIVFENDDTYKDGDPMNLTNSLEKKIFTLDKFIELADLVTTTTEFLAEEYRKINKNVVVLKNCINISDWPDVPSRTNSKKVRIGIFGSATLNGDSNVIKNLLQELSEREDVQLVMFCLPSKKTNKEIIDLFTEEEKFWDELDIEWQPLVQMKDYFKTLDSLALDITLIPRKDNYFNRCKSNLKFLEASMLEIPVIAQGFGDGLSPYQGEEDKKYMAVANNENDFREFVNLFISDKKLRRHVGKEAKKYVIKNYNIKKEFKKWAEAYAKI